MHRIIYIVYILYAILYTDYINFITSAINRLSYEGNVGYTDIYIELYVLPSLKTSSIIIGVYV